MDKVVLEFAESDTEALEFIEGCKEIDERDLVLIRSCEGSDIIYQIIIGIQVLLGSPSLVRLFSRFPQRKVLFDENGNLEYAQGYSAKDVVKMIRAKKK